jgi:hypothetical protein
VISRIARGPPGRALQRKRAQRRGLFSDELGVPTRSTGLALGKSCANQKFAVKE